MGTNINDDQWSNIKSTPPLSVQGIQFKIVHRLHVSMVKLSKMYPVLNTVTFVSKHLPPFFTFWSRSSINSFWSSIFELYSAISGLPIEPCLFIGLFGVPS